jgi:hypothetical protein
MAQELEKTPEGATAIKMDRDGAKLVDMHRVAQISASALGGQQREIEKLKKRVQALSRSAA